MNLFAEPPDPDDPARLDLEVGRVVQRLRTLSVDRLGQPIADGRSRAQSALDLAQELVEARARILGDPPRILPDVPHHAAADVLAVAAADLVEALRGLIAAGRDTDVLEATGQVCTLMVNATENLRREI